MSFLQAAASTSNTNAYTFSAQNLGTAAADRHIVVAIQSSRNSSQTISSVSIGGVAATIVAQVTSGATDDMTVAGIAIAAVPTGTSGDIVVTFSGTMSRCVIQAYRLTGLSSATPVDTGTSTAAAPTTNLDLVAGGEAVGCCGSSNGPATSVAWTGLTEDADQVSESLIASSASLVPGATSTVTVTATITGTNSNPAGAFASWSPAGGGSSPSSSPSSSTSSSPSASASSSPSASASSSPSTSPSSSPSSSVSSSPSSSASSSPSASVSSSPSSSASSSPSSSVSSSPSSSPSTSASSTPSASPSSTPSASASSTPSASVSSSPSASPSPSSSVSASPSTSPSGEAATITIESNIFTRVAGGVNVDSNRVLQLQMTNEDDVVFTFEETVVS